MKKILINRSYGGFGISDETIQKYCSIKNIDWHYSIKYDISRDDPVLIALIEEMKEQANGKYSELKIVEIPDDMEWHIAEYDGLEWVAENHRTFS